MKPENNATIGRVYDREQDREAAHRTWIECGWIEPEEKKLNALDLFLDSSRVRVADLRGEVESMVTTVPGDFLHTDELLPYSIVSSVNTGRVGRGRGLAGRLLAESIAEDAGDGAVAAGLGIFDQGFYDRLGFGTTVYERMIAFDPTTLVDFPLPEVPKRLGLDDAEAIHQCRLARLRRHGSVNLFATGHTQADIMLGKNAFGLGLPGDDGLDAFVWFSSDEVESGPYDVWWSAWRSWEDIPRVLAILKSLQDQVRLFKMREPVYLQMQDYLTRPLRNQGMSRSSKFDQRTRAVAYHQLRICDLERAISAWRIEGAPIEFNLTLEDPIESFLPESSRWRGCGGEYSVRLGDRSEISRGHIDGLPLLHAGIGPFSRLWAGALSPRALAVDGGLTAPGTLLDRIGTQFHPTLPSPDWDY